MVCIWFTCLLVKFPFLFIFLMTAYLFKIDKIVIFMLIKLIVLKSQLHKY